MKRSRVLLALVIAAAVALGAAGCGSSMEDTVTDLVQGNLNSLYLDKADADYVKMIKSSAEECHQDYLDGIDTEADFFSRYFDIENFTPEMRSQVTELYQQIYAQTQFTVSPAVKDGDVYTVEVRVAPIDVMQRAYDAWDDAIAPVQEKYAELDLSDDAVYAAYDAEWGQTAIDVVRAQLSDLGHLAEETLSIHVEKNSDGVWTIRDEDLQSFDELVIYYP